MLWNYSNQAAVPSTAAVDWLSVSIAIDSPNAARFREISLSALEIEESIVGKGRKVRFHTFAGLRAGRVAVMKSDAYFQCTISSDLANDYFRDFAVLKAKASRIDFAVDTRLVNQDLAWVTKAFLKADLAWNNPTSKKNTKRPVLTGSPDGWTAYFGSRHSQLYFRLYDKGGARGETPGWFMRYECEIKGDLANVALHKLGTLPASEVGEFIASYVWGKYKEKGLAEYNFSYQGYKVELKVPKHTSDAFAKLAWLATSVRPTVEHLTRIGYFHEVLSALGFMSYTEKESSDDD